MSRRSGRILACLLVLGLVSACEAPAAAPERFALEASQSPSLVVRVKQSARRVQAVVADVDHLLVTVKASDGAEPTQRIEKSSFSGSDASVSFSSLASGAATVEVKALDAASRVLGKASVPATVTPGVLTHVDVPLQLEPDYQPPATAAATAPIAIDLSLRDGEALIPSPTLGPWGTEVEESIESMAIIHMVADSDGRLWMADEWYTISWGDLSLGGGPAGAGLVVDSTGRAWAASASQLQSGATTISLSARTAFNGLGIDGSDHLWVANGAQVTKLSPAGAELGRFPLGGTAGALAVDPASGDVWVGAGRDLVRLTPTGAEAARATGVLLPGDVWREIAVDADGNAWALQYDGHRVAKVAPDGALLGNFKVCYRPSGIVSDHAGHVYVVSLEGVYKVSSDGAVLGMHVFSRLDPSVQDLPSDARCDVAIRDDGDVWASLADNTGFSRLFRIRP